jgi:subtilisin family serine protease
MTQRAMVSRRVEAAAPFAGPPEKAVLIEWSELRDMGFAMERRLSPGWLVRRSDGGTSDEPWLRLEGRGYRVKVLPDTELLEVGAYRIDVESGGTFPAVPPELAVPAESAGSWPHHLVQLIAPPRSEWIARIEAAGVDVVEPISRYGLFVCGAGDQVASLRGLSLSGDPADDGGFVVWTGAFQPAYRVAPELLHAQGRIRYVQVVVYPEARADETEQAIRESGGVTVNRWGADGTYRDRFASLVIELDAGRLFEVARLPWIRSLHYLSGRMYAEDERAAQIVAPKLDSRPPPDTSPVRAYATVLSTLGLDGDGVMVGICDTGLDGGDGRTFHADLQGRLAFYSDVTHSQTPADVDGHGTHVAGIVAGNGMSGETEPGDWILGQGIAPAARMGCVNAVDTDGSPGLTTSLADYTRTMVRNGAHVMNNSWGLGLSIGYSPNAALVDRLVRDPGEPAKPIKRPWLWCSHRVTKAPV